jgi:hypothetical protein
VLTPLFFAADAIYAIIFIAAIFRQLSFSPYAADAGCRYAMPLSITRCRRLILLLMLIIDAADFRCRLPPSAAYADYFDVASCFRYAMPPLISPLF